MPRYSKKEPSRERQLRHSTVLFRRGQHGLASRLVRCANSAAAAKDSGQAYASYQCESRYCEYCGPRNTARYRRTYAPILEDLAQQGYRLSQLVLVSDNVRKLERGRTDRLLQVFKKLYRTKPLKGRVVGALVQYEVNRDGDWHPHLHVILVYKSCPSWHEISKAWYRHTGSNHIYIEKIDYDSSDPQSVRDAVGGMLNYVCKYTSFDNDQSFDAMFESTRHKRLRRTYGLLRQ